MLTREFVTSCSNPNVAQAALASIGGAFALRFESHAEKMGVSAGLLAASAVQAFASSAKAIQWVELKAAMSGRDQPVLAGLEHVLQIALSQDDGLRRTDQNSKPDGAAFSPKSSGLSAERGYRACA